MADAVVEGKEEGKKDAEEGEWDYRNRVVSPVLCVCGAARLGWMLGIDAGDGTYRGRRRPPQS